MNPKTWKTVIDNGIELMNKTNKKKNHKILEIEKDDTIDWNEQRKKLCYEYHWF